MTKRKYHGESSFEEMKRVNEEVKEWLRAVEAPVKPSWRNPRLPAHGEVYRHKRTGGCRQVVYVTRDHIFWKRPDSNAPSTKCSHKQWLKFVGGPDYQNVSRLK